MTRLIVERVDRIPSRPWLFVTGRLEGNAVHVGDVMTVSHGQAAQTSAVIRAIEFHSRPGKTTIAVDGDLADSVQVGATLSRD